MLETLRKALQKYSQDYGNDSVARKAVHQLVATAIKHGADRVHISFGAESSVRFDFTDGQQSTVKLAVDANKLLGVLFVAGEVTEQQQDRVVGRVQVSFRNLRVNIGVVATLRMESEGPQLSALVLQNFEVGFPLQDQGTGPAHSSDGSVLNPKPAVREGLTRDADDGLPPPQKRETLLVIEDDADQRAILQKIFEREGYVVEVAQDGIDGLVTASRIIPSVIIVDFMMPEMDGGETIRRLRSNPLTAKIPVVVLTAYPSTDVEYNMLQAGADDFCAKSISKKVLLKRIQRLVHTN